MSNNTNTPAEAPEGESATNARAELKNALQNAIDEKLAAKRNLNGEISHADRRSAREEARAELRREIEARNPLPFKDPTIIESEAVKRHREEQEVTVKAKIAQELKEIGMNNADSSVDTAKDYAAATTETLFSENMSETAKVAVTGGLAGAAMIGAGALLWKWWNSGKQHVTSAVDAGKQAAAESGGGWLKKILIGTGIGLAVFVGYKGWQLSQKYDSLEAAYKDGKKVVKEKYEEVKGAVIKKKDDVVDAVKTKVEDAKKTEAGKEVKEGVEKIVIKNAPSPLLEWFGDEAEAVGFTDIYEPENAIALSHTLEKMIKENQTLDAIMNYTSDEEYYKILFKEEKVSSDIRQRRIQSIHFLQQIIRETSNDALSKSLKVLHEQNPERWPENIAQLSVKEYVHLIYSTKLNGISSFTSEHLGDFIKILGSGSTDAIQKFIDSSKKEAEELGEYEWAVLTKDYPNRLELNKKNVLKAFCSNQYLFSGSFQTDQNTNKYDKEFLEQQREKMKQRLCGNPLSSDVQELCLNDPQIIAAVQSQKDNITFAGAMRLSIALEQGNTIAGIAVILSIIQNCGADVFSTACSHYAQWMGGSVLSVLLSDAKSVINGGVSLDEENLPPNLRRITKLIRRRTYHEAMTTLKATGAVVKDLATNKYVYTGVGIAGGAYTGSLYAWINRNGDFAAVGNKAGGWGRGASKTALHYGLGILSDYHHSVGVSSGDLTQSVDELMNLVMKDKKNGGRIKNTLDDFIHLEQTEEDWTELIQKVRIMLSNDNHPILSKLKDIKEVHAKGFKHYSRWFGSRVFQNARNILNTDPQYARTRNISKLEQIFNPTDNLMNVNNPYKNLTPAQRSSISKLLSNTDLDNAELHFLKDSRKGQKAFLEIADMTNDAAKAVKMKELKNILRSAAKLSAVMKGVGVIGDIFDIASQMYGNSILAEERKTASPERRQAIDQKLETAWKRYTINGGIIGATALETAIGYKMGLGVMGSLGYSSAALGPGMIIIGGMLFMTDNANELALSMSREYRDYYKKSESELLAELDNHPNHSTWSQWWNKDFTMSEDLFKSANENHRAEIFRAFIAKNTALQPFPEETTENFTKRHAEVVSATIRSLARQKSQDGKFINLSPENLRDAKLDGELVIFSRTMEEQEEANEATEEEKTSVMVKGTDGLEYKVFLSDYASLSDSDDGKTSMLNNEEKPFTRKDVRNAFQENREKVMMTQVLDYAKESKMPPEQLRKVIATKLLSECSDEVHFLSHAFMTYDYSGLLGWDEEMKNACLNLAEREIANIIVSSADRYSTEYKEDQNPAALYQATRTHVQGAMRGISPDTFNAELNEEKSQNLLEALSSRDLQALPITPETILKKILEKNEKTQIEEKDKGKEGSEKSVFDISDILAMKTKIIEKKGEMYVKNAKGYRFVRIVNGGTLCTEDCDVIITSNEVSKMPHGTYAIFAPDEIPNREEPGRLGKFSFRNEYTDEERNIREATLNLRLKKGVLTMESRGVQKISQYCYSISKGIEGQVLYYFDRSRMEWNVTTIDPELAYNPKYVEQYAASHNDLQKGQDPATVFPQEHRETVRAMQKVNEEKPNIPKKAPEPSPKTPPITQPPPPIVA